MVRFAAYYNALPHQTQSWCFGLDKLISQQQQQQLQTCDCLMESVFMRQCCGKADPGVGGGEAQIFVTFSMEKVIRDRDQLLLSSPFQLPLLLINQHPRHLYHLDHTSFQDKPAAQQPTKQLLPSVELVSSLEAAAMVKKTGSKKASKKAQATAAGRQRTVSVGSDSSDGVPSLGSSSTDTSPPQSPQVSAHHQNFIAIKTHKSKEKSKRNHKRSHHKKKHSGGADQSSSSSSSQARTKTTNEISSDYNTSHKRGGETDKVSSLFASAFHSNHQDFDLEAGPWQSVVSTGKKNKSVLEDLEPQSEPTVMSGRRAPQRSSHSPGSQFSFEFHSSFDADRGLQCLQERYLEAC